MSTNIPTTDVHTSVITAAATNAAAKTPVTSSTHSAVAYERAKPDLEEAAKGELATLNIDVPTVVRVMLVANGNARAFRPRMDAEAPMANLAMIDKLETYATALGYIDALNTWAQERKGSVEPLAEEVRNARRVLMTELDLLRARGVVGPQEIPLLGTSGYNAIIKDVRSMCTAFMAGWETIGPEIGNRFDRVEEALAAADKLQAALVQAEQLQDKQRGTAMMRLAAWTLALKSYRELERVIAYLRFHEDDAQLIVPTLFKRGNGKSKTKETETPDTDPVVDPLKPIIASNGTPATPAAPGAPILPQKAFDE